MTIRITVDVFSGRPNPSAELDERESAEVLDRLMPLRRLGDEEPDPPSEPTLGYRGLVIEQIGDRREALPDVFRVAGSDMFGRGLAHRARDARVETYLISPDGPLGGAGLDRALMQRLPEEAERCGEIRRSWPVTFPPIPFYGPTSRHARTQARNRRRSATGDACCVPPMGAPGGHTEALLATAPPGTLPPLPAY